MEDVFLNSMCVWMCTCKAAKWLKVMACCSSLLWSANMFSVPLFLMGIRSPSYCNADGVVYHLDLPPTNHMSKPKTQDRPVIVPPSPVNSDSSNRVSHSLGEKMFPDLRNFLFLLKLLSCGSWAHPSPPRGL